nr:MobV family relaxase [Mammaliicoccus sciuri]
MSMIVARMQKMKAENLVGIGNHNQRKTKNHSNPDIDTSLSKLNYDLVDRTQNYKTDIENFINENKSTTRAVRKDAVLVNEWIISSDKDFFDNLTESEIENFFERSKDYFAEKFGEKNIRYATVHLDESTPHMHMGIVPFDKDNKLSAKRVFNPTSSS